MSRIERWIALLNDKVSYEEKEEYAMNDQAMTDVLKAYDQFLQWSGCKTYVFKTRDGAHGL